MSSASRIVVGAACRVPHAGVVPRATRTLASSAGTPPQTPKKLPTAGDVAKLRERQRSIRSKQTTGTVPRAATPTSGPIARRGPPTPAAAAATVREAVAAAASAAAAARGRGRGGATAVATEDDDDLGDNERVADDDADLDDDGEGASDLSDEQAASLKEHRSSTRRIYPVSTPNNERKHSLAFTNSSDLINYLFTSPHAPVHHAPKTSEGFFPTDLDNPEVLNTPGAGDVDVALRNITSAARKDSTKDSAPGFVPHNIYNTVTVEMLMDANVHLGSSMVSSKMVSYVYGMRRGLAVINLEHTLTYLRRAIRAVKRVAYYGGRVVFVGQRPGIHRVVAEAARRSGMHYVTDWKRGIIRNRDVVLFRSVGYNPNDSVHTRKATLDDLITMNVADLNQSSGPVTPEEVEKRLEMKRLELLDMRKQRIVKVPDMIVLLDMKNSRDILYEANLENIPVVALCDTDCDPTVVTYPIPGNDDSLYSVKAIATCLSLAAKEGRIERERAIAYSKESNQAKSNMMQQSSSTFFTGMPPRSSAAKNQRNANNARSHAS